ncbi:MAG: NTP transferase domain-containing protein [Puniceicoccales bacterium]|jgi:NDP-sugar pyrophosphorylase family protein|nr:NTP transferase domain-containing protein [Puniceicoccales bacterium]
MNSVSVLVLAAGLGSRFGGLKQLTTFGPGEHTILEYSLFDAHRLGFRRVVCVIQEIHQKFFNRLLAPLKEHMEIEFAYQRLDDVPVEISNPHRTKPWGTAHAVYSARDHLHAPFVIINADDFYGRRAWAQMANFIRQTPSGNALVAFRLDHTLPPDRPVARGICHANGDHLVKIEEFSRITRSNGTIRALGREECFSGDEPTSLNFWYLQREVLREMDFKRFFAHGMNLMEAEWMLPVTIQDLLDEGKIRITVVNTQSQWVGITHPDDVEAVTSHIENATRSGIYPKEIWRTKPPTCPQE